MIIKHDISGKEGTLLHLSYTPEAGDRTEYFTNAKKKVTLNKRKCVFQVPQGVDLNKIHPDLLGLVCLLTIYPFIGNRLQLSFKVGKGFANAVRKNLGIEIGNRFVDGGIKDRSGKGVVGKGTVPALCFSNGVDSTACLTVMPKETVCVFLDRIFYREKNYMYNKDNVYNGINNANRLMPNKFLMVRSDFEDLRRSNGFAIDIGVGTGAILLADKLNFDSVAYGYCLHDFSQIGNGTVSRICTGDFTNFEYGKWNEIYKSVGLYINLTIMGLTEIGTWKKSLSSPLRDNTSACMRGRLHRPCLNCSKCFRKTLLKLFIKCNGNWNNINKNSGNKAMLKRMLGLKFANMKTILDGHGTELTFYYITRNYNGNIRLFRDIATYYKRQLGNRMKVIDKYIDSWMPNSTKYIHPKYRKYISSKMT